MDQESTVGMCPGDRETFESHPIGEYLRRQRLLRGMTVEELSDLTRIPLRSLERLEGGHFDGESDGFVRGFVRTVAAALGLDTDDAVARMLQEPEASAWERHSPSRMLKQSVVISIFLLLTFVILLGLRSVWGAVAGEAADPASRAAVIWRDPVRALAEAHRVQVGGALETIDPSAPLEPASLKWPEAAPASNQTAIQHSPPVRR